jgi:hypothetical protein
MSTMDPLLVYTNNPEPLRELSNIMKAFCIFFISAEKDPNCGILVVLT